MDWLIVINCHHRCWMLTSSGPTLAIVLEAILSPWMTLSMEYLEVGMENVIAAYCNEIKAFNMYSEFTNSCDDLNSMMIIDLQFNDMTLF